MKNMNHNIYYNQKGYLTLDFLFSVTLILGLSGILYALSFTLSVIEATQYIAFASSRNYFAGHLTRQDQEDAGEDKYSDLLDKPGIGNLMKKNWFNLTHEFKNFAGEYNAKPEDAPNFEGIRISMNAKFLDFHIPFYGSTAGSGSRSGFETKLTSFLGREPSSDECKKFFENRWQLMKAKNAGYAVMGSLSADAPAVIDDSGC